MRHAEKSCEDLGTMQTTNPLNYLFAAYAAIWIILAIYLFSIQSREKKLRDELNHLKQLLEQKVPKAVT
jgi:CcmD family protein